MASLKKLIIVCGGGFAREVIWLARECNEWEIIGILDDTPNLQGQMFCDVPVLGTIEEWSTFKETFFVVALGSPRSRKAIVERMSQQGVVPFATLIHPTVSHSKYVTVGEGSIITAGCILTTQIEIGKHFICNLSTTVGHDAVIGDYVTIAPQVVISGNTTMGDGVEIGTGAVLIEKLSIGCGAFVGAGSVVTKSLSDNGMFVGSPARLLKTLPLFNATSSLNGQKN